MKRRIRCLAPAAGMPQKADGIAAAPKTSALCQLQTHAPQQGPRMCCRVTAGVPSLCDAASPASAKGPICSHPKTEAKLGVRNRTLAECEALGQGLVP